MKTFLLWLVLTAVFMALLNAYAEYCISREIESGLQAICSVAMLAVIVAYFFFLIKQIIKSLKLKKP